MPSYTAGLGARPGVSLLGGAARDEGLAGAPKADEPAAAATPAAAAEQERVPAPTPTAEAPRPTTDAEQTPTTSDPTPAASETTPDTPTPAASATPTASATPAASPAPAATPANAPAESKTAAPQTKSPAAPEAATPAAKPSAEAPSPTPTTAPAPTAKPGAEAPTPTAKPATEPATDEKPTGAAGAEGAAPETEKKEAGAEGGGGVGAEGGGAAVAGVPAGGEAAATPTPLTEVAPEVLTVPEVDSAPAPSTEPQPSNYNAAKARAQVADRVATMRSGAVERKGRVTEAAEDFKVKIAREGLARQDQVRAIVAIRLDEMRGEIASARMDIGSEIETRKLEVSAAAADEFKAAETQTQTRIAEIKASAEEYKERARTAVTTRQVAARAFGLGEAKRTREALEADAAEASARGADKAATYPAGERGQVQAQAASGVADGLAADISEQIPDLEEKNVEAGNQMADGIGAAADKLISGIDSETEKLTTTLAEQLETLRPEYATLEAQTHEALDLFAGELYGQLDQTEASAESELMTLADDAVLQIGDWVSQSQALVEEHAETCRVVIDDIADEAAARSLAKRGPDVKRERARLSRAESAMDKAVGKFTDQMAEAEASGASTLADVTAQLDLALGDTVASVQVAMGETVVSTIDGSAEIADNGRRAMVAISIEWDDAVLKAKADAELAYGDAITKMEGELDAKLGETKAEITKGNDDAVAKSAEPLAKLDGEMEKAASRARAEYDKPWYESAFDYVWGAVSSFVKAALRVLAIVAVFVVGVILLIAGAVLLFFGSVVTGIILIVAGLILVIAVVAYALYGIVANIIDRVRSADTWYGAIWGFVVGVLDLTGIPRIIEGLIFHDIVNGRKLTAKEAGERLGQGILDLLLVLIPLKMKMRGKGGGGGEGGMGGRGGKGGKGGGGESGGGGEGAGGKSSKGVGGGEGEGGAGKGKGDAEVGKGEGEGAGKDEGTPKDEPVKEEPPGEEPVKEPTEEPAKEEPPTEEPVKDEPVNEEPVKDKPVTDEPVKEEPVKEEPVKEEGGDEKGPAAGKPAWWDSAPCFVRGTPVETPRGVVPIDALVAGDEVLAKRPGEGEPRPCRVAAVHRGVRDRGVRVALGGGGSLTATRNHPFYVVGRGWTPARRLRAGDLLEELGGGHVEVFSVEPFRPEAPFETFNLSVEECSTYFVRAARDSVLVHNGDGDDGWRRTLYWLFGPKPGVRPGDTDGLSVWRTNSPEEVRTFMSYRKGAMKRGADKHGYYTLEQLAAAGLDVPPTPGDGELSQYLQHHSIRPQGAEPYPARLTGGKDAADPKKLTGQLGELQAQLDALPKPQAQVPDKLKC
ncbi:MAG TPA: polymorphic toxin-type HINT domain-containing protein [Pyrinomonadaceae bacterium]|jgi:hypothetical protein